MKENFGYNCNPLYVITDQIRSYSQLRSELKAGQRTFYVYSNHGKPTSNPLPYTTRNQREMRNKNAEGYSNNQHVSKAILGKVDSNSSSDISSFHEGQDQKRHKQQYRRSHTESPARRTGSHSPTPLTPYT